MDEVVVFAYHDTEASRQRLGGIFNGSRRLLPDVIGIPFAGLSFNKGKDGHFYNKYTSITGQYSKHYNDGVVIVMGREDFYSYPPAGDDQL